MGWAVDVLGELELWRRRGRVGVGREREGWGWEEGRRDEGLMDRPLQERVGVVSDISATPRSRTGYETEELCAALCTADSDCAGYTRGKQGKRDSFDFNGYVRACVPVCSLVGAVWWCPPSWLFA